ncbi:uncharacterized protein EV420DRAFT_836921 [Desarmillaria tabescens]|uniref:Uncharacterized protein n=1 Tax=Armillaria tabescens TaxID=1929756 RepID=A0AA39MWV2_ARMTA|nr:uncharacterized protein EV420DRAFT_836921 [Desarmillaria tabescens]KAK0448984.1 hypothetical protein EV420DRAFT_836921 [Desarmillaria tabescens]
MRFSLASLAPLAALAVPGLSATINARQPETGNNTIQGRDYYGSYAPWKPSWTWPGTDKHCPTDVPEYCPCLDDPVCGFECPSQWPYNKCTWEPVFVDRYDWKGWKPGKRDPFSCGYVDKVTYEIDCKDLCLAHDNCNSCQVYTLEEAAEQFICALFEEIVDITTWEDDCEDDWVDDWVYYSSSYWNVYYQAT